MVDSGHSDRILFTTQNDTAGMPGRLYLVDPGNAPVVVDDLGVRPLLLRGVETAAGAWVGVATSIESNIAHVIVWDGADQAAVVDSFATGEDPLVPAVWSSLDTTIATLIPNFGAGSATVARVAAATGDVLGSVTIPAHPSCGDPGSALAVQGGARIVITCRATNGLWIVDPAQVQIPGP